MTKKMTEADALSKDVVAVELVEIGNGWEFCEKHNAIEKDYARKDFSDATAFIGSIAPIANAQDHHPDVLLHDYKMVRIMLSTHSAKGITQNDFTLARAIDGLQASQVK
jgi:4a-hydroxytetrahydrobiopterin dehydratase